MTRYEVIRAPAARIAFRSRGRRPKARGGGGRERTIPLGPRELARDIREVEEVLAIAMAEEIANSASYLRDLLWRLERARDYVDYSTPAERRLHTRDRFSTYADRNISDTASMRHTGINCRWNHHRNGRKSLPISSKCFPEIPKMLRPPLDCSKGHRAARRHQHQSVEIYRPLRSGSVPFASGIAARRTLSLIASGDVDVSELAL